MTSLRSLSRAVAHALRHDPWLYELELDDEGWTPVAALLAALRERGSRWAGVERADLEAMIRVASKRRYEIDGERIRALYGHSIPDRLSRQPAAPPALLFHGTSLDAAARILRDGLRPMGRQHVHLSTDIDTATQVGQRKSRSPIILRVRAGEASRAGVAFYRGSDIVWLADEVPARFLRMP